MTVVLSSSSPLASVALLDESGALLAEGREEAKMQASGALLFTLDRLLADTGLSLAQARVFAADLGPGSFTGVKVAVTMAKVMAFAHQVPAAGVTAFDLVSTSETVAIRSRKGEFFLRIPGEAPHIVAEVPTAAVGSGEGLGDQRYPLAENAARLPLEPVRPESLVPFYVAEPSISKPRDRRLLEGPRA